ncbi:MAG TPA: hypothetical protein VIL48_18150 [Acidimicrobiales bacterium]
MKPLRLVAAAGVWLAAGVVAALGVLLSATIVLLPLGVPLLLLSRKLYARFARLVLPRAVAHPVREAKRRVRRVSRRLQLA